MLRKDRGRDSIPFLTELTGLATARRFPWEHLRPLKCNDALQLAERQVISAELVFAGWNFVVRIRANDAIFGSVDNH